MISKCPLAKFKTKGVDIMAKKITKEFIIEITEKMLNGAKYKMETEQDKKIYVNDIARVQDMIKKL